MKIICIAGKARNGKDTGGVFLKEALGGSKCVIVHYADLLKFICKQYFGWNGEKDEYGRTLLQVVGTDKVRRKDPDYWVRFVKSLSELFDGEWDYMVIPDCRFPNEIDKLKGGNNQVISIKIERDGFTSPLTAEQQQHLSETALDNYAGFDYIVKNEGTLEDFKNNIYKIAAKIA